MNQNDISMGDLIEFEWSAGPTKITLFDGTEVMAEYGDKFYGEEDADEDCVRFHFHVKAKQ